MTEPTSLTPLLAHEEAERDRLLAAFRQAQARADAALAQAEQLLAYRGEYQQRWRGQFAGASASIDILRCYQGFHDRLDQAVGQQERIAAHAQAQLAQAREALAAQELRVASVRKLIERRQAEARQAAGRRDQKQTDEAAARALHGSGWSNDGALRLSAGAL